MIVSEVALLQVVAQRAARFQFSIGIRFQARVRDDGAFPCEAFDVLGFPWRSNSADEQWEVRITMPSGAKHPVELALQCFPNAVAPRANHHATAYIRRLGQFRSANDLLIPFRKIFVSAWRNRCF